MSEQKDLVVPALGESITEAVIARWLKNVGDPVAVDEPVVDLETDKITVQLPSPAAGTLAEQAASVGATVAVGASVGKIQVGDGAAARPAGTPSGTPEATRVIEMPVRMSSEPGKPGPVLAPPPESPAQSPFPQPVAAAPVPQPERGRSDIEEAALRRLTPAQRRAARLGETVPHAAPEAAVPAPVAAAGTPSAPRLAAAPLAVPAAVTGLREEVVPMSPLRRRIAERLVQAQHETASLTTFNEVDMSAVMAVRNRYKDAFADEFGVKLGFMSFFAKACVAACQKFPGLNAEIRGDAIVYKKHYDFGVAVSTERGLVVPVLRNVDRLGFADIEQAIIDLAGKARQGKLTLEDLTGGTFTITNGGIFGSMLSTPLLNYPQTGILGMHNIVSRPVAVGDKVEIRPIMYIALTYDHRVVDGREAVQFLVAVKERIEQPDKLMLGL